MHPRPFIHPGKDKGTHSKNILWGPTYYNRGNSQDEEYAAFEPVN